MSKLDAARNIWHTAQNMLRGEVSPEIFQTWFAQITCAGSESGTAKDGATDILLLEAQTAISELWIETNYRATLERCITLAAGCKMSFKLQLPAGGEVPEPVAPPRPKPVRTKSAPPPPPPAIKRDNTFDSFIVGPENELAHSAAKVVSNEPGTVYNPLFIYGATGLGKTHLLHAIAHAVMANRPNARILYLTCETFTNDYINCVQEKSLTDFRRRHRETDLLLLDDVQFLAKKERTQEEFFHTFNELHNSHKQIVLTSDRNPNEMDGLESRLVTRFQWGLTTDVGEPSQEVRTAILRKKAELNKVNLPLDVAVYLAERIQHNIRNLEGAILRLKALQGTAAGRREPLTIANATVALSGILNEEAKERMTPEIIQRVVSEYFRIPVSDMTSKKRTAQVAFARQVAMHLCSSMTGMSLTAVGDAFGGRDHGTVIHARKTVENQCETNQAAKRDVEFLVGKLHNSRP